LQRHTLKHELSTSNHNAYNIFELNVGALGQQRDNIVRAAILCGIQQLVSMDFLNTRIGQ
jgi:hypothetical protein